MAEALGGSVDCSLSFSPCLQSIEPGGMLCTALCKSGSNAMSRPATACAEKGYMRALATIMKHE